jgi:glycosyltransferase involved in cell wall biosynthesis
MQNMSSTARRGAACRGYTALWGVYCTPRKSPLPACRHSIARSQGMPKRRFRVLAIGTHPVQYQVPIFRRMAAREDLDLQVAYCTLRGAEAAHDPEFGATVKWDIPLLDGYSWVRVPNGGSSGESFFGLCNWGLWNFIRTGRFDAVLCYVSYTRATFWISYFAAKISRTAFLFGTDTVTLSPLDGKMWKRHVKRLAWPMLFRLADQVIVPSSGTRDLMRSLRLPDDRITLTPYVVDNDWWLAQSAGVDRAAVRASWGAEPEDMVILFCAKLQPWKRPADLLRAFAKIKLPRGLLVLAGEGPLRASLEAEATTLGVAGRVRFLGFANQTQLPAIYTSADLMVLPSMYDAFGVVVNESMLCGCPVVASDHVGAARDLIEHGRTGFVYPCGDTDALAAILRQALQNRGQLLAMGGAARARMESWSPRENIDAAVEAISRGVARVKRVAGGSDTVPTSPTDSARGAAHKLSE